MLKQAPKWLWLAAVLLAVSPGLVGCVARTGATPDRLTFNLPATLTIERGTTLLNTTILYDSYTDDGIYLLVDGQRALKRKGDSVRWKGTPVAGADVDLDLRVVWYTEEQVHLAGKASVTVSGVSPRYGAIDTSAPMSFSGPVAYGIAPGANIPGTTLSYVGASEEGAELGGLYNEYPYRRIGDSIVWEGQLRPGVSLRLELRTAHFGNSALRVAGIATLWLGP